MQNDDDIKALLTEIRDTMKRVEARDGEWIQKCRELTEAANKTHRRIAGQWRWVVVLVAIFVVGMFFTIWLRTQHMI